MKIRMARYYRNKLNTCLSIALAKTGLSHRTRGLARLFYKGWDDKLLHDTLEAILPLVGQDLTEAQAKGYAVWMVNHELNGNNTAIYKYGPYRLEDVKWRIKLNLTEHSNYINITYWMKDMLTHVRRSTLDRWAIAVKIVEDQRALEHL